MALARVTPGILAIPPSHPESPAAVAVQAHGNILSAVAYLRGMPARELRKEELDFSDATYQLITVAVKLLAP